MRNNSIYRISFYPPYKGYPQTKSLTVVIAEPIESKMPFIVVV